MTNATKTFGLAFIISLLLLGLNFIFGGTGDTEIFRGNLIEADTSAINRLVIEQPSESARVELVKDGEEWQVESDGASYKTDSQRIFDFLGEITDMEIQALLTRDTGKHSRYSVDTTGIRLSLFRDTEKLDELIVSSGRSSGISSYVRKAGYDEVYSVNALNRLPGQTNTNYWRDKTIWSVPEADISEIQFVYPADSSFTIRRENGGWYSQSDSLNQSKTGTLVNQLAGVEAVRFTGEEGSLADALYSIRVIRENGQQLVLNLKPGQVENEAPFYVAQTDQIPYQFTLSKRTWDQTVVLRREDLLVE